MEWMDNLKPGDQAILEGSGVGHNSEIVTVERLTKTLVVLEGGQRYRRSNGFRSGDRSSWNWTRLVEYTEGKALAINHRKLRESIEYKIHKRVLSDLPMDKLIAIARLLP